MQTLFNALTTFRSVEGTRWESQDDAILCSILHLIGGKYDEEYSLDNQAGPLFETIREYNLLDHTFQQMVRLGYLEAPQLPAPAETVGLATHYVDERGIVEHTPDTPSVVTFDTACYLTNTSDETMLSWLHQDKMDWNEFLTEGQVALVRSIVAGERDPLTWEWLDISATECVAQEVPTARPVIYDLMDICGGKADGWLRMLDGTEGQATELRRMIVMDYQYNSHDVDGIDKLGRVLKFISESIKPVVTENMCEPVAAIAELISYKYTIQQLVDRLNREGGDFGTESVTTELKHHNEKYRTPKVLGRLYSPTYVLDHHEYEFLCELYSLKSESHYDGYGNARTLFGLYETRKQRGGNPIEFDAGGYMAVVQAFKAKYDYTPSSFDGISASIRSWFYNQYGS